MGTNLVALILRDGRRIEPVLIGWGDQILRVAGSEHVNVPIDDLVDVVSLI